MGMEIKVTSGAMATLIVEAASHAPAECCGLLLGNGFVVEQAVPAANVHHDPLRHFEIDPAALIAAHKAARGGGPALIGYYHSHPDGHPLPSATDCEHSHGDGMVWAIVAGGEVRFYRDIAQGTLAAVMHRLVGNQL